MKGLWRESQELEVDYLDNHGCQSWHLYQKSSGCRQPHVGLPHWVSQQKPSGCDTALVSQHIARHGAFREALKAMSCGHAGGGEVCCGCGWEHDEQQALYPMRRENQPCP
jgi:hypothetical protein